MTDFCEAAGLTFPVRRWLRDNEGQPLREEIVKALMDAFEDECTPARATYLRTLIKHIPVSAQFI